MKHPPSQQQLHAIWVITATQQIEEVALATIQTSSYVAVICRPTYFKIEW
jgi:hypothetical protein